MRRSVATQLLYPLLLELALILLDFSYYGAVRQLSKLTAPLLSVCFPFPSLTPQVHILYF